MERLFVLTGEIRGLARLGAKGLSIGGDTREALVFLADSQGRVRELSQADEAFLKDVQGLVLAKEGRVLARSSFMGRGALLDKARRIAQGETAKALPQAGELSPIPAPGEEGGPPRSPGAAGEGAETPPLAPEPGPGLALGPSPAAESPEAEEAPWEGMGEGVLEGPAEGREGTPEAPRGTEPPLEEGEDPSPGADDPPSPEPSGAAEGEAPPCSPIPAGGVQGEAAPAPGKPGAGQEPAALPPGGGSEALKDILARARILFGAPLPEGEEASAPSPEPEMGSPAREGDLLAGEQAEAAEASMAYAAAETLFAPFPGAFSGASWQRIPYPATGRHYLEGRFSRNGQRFLIHAIPGSFAPVPPIKGYTRFLQARDGAGYWIRVRRMN